MFRERMRQTHSRAMTVAAASLIAAGAVSPGSRAAASQQDVELARRGAVRTTSFDARAALTEYCTTCHNQRLSTAGLALDVINPDEPGTHAEVWEKVLRKLLVRTMPPAGVRRPDEPTYERLISFLEEKLDEAAAARPNPGRHVLYRLNRAEYANAVRDLLGLEVDVSSMLPPDDAAHGFDNVADALGSSPALLQAYLAAARKISTVAVGDEAGRPVSATHTVRQDLSQDHQLEELPLGTVGGTTVRHVFLSDGDYEFQVRLYRTNLNAMRGLEDPHQLELAIDGQRVLLAPIGGEQDLIAVQQNPTDASDRIEASRLRVRVPVKAGEHEITAAFLDEVPPLLETNRLQRFIRDFSSPYDAEGSPHVQSITIQGPVGGVQGANPPSTRLFVCRPSAPSEERACATRILTTLARRAYRRPPADEDVAHLMSFYDQGRKGGSFERGIAFGLRRVLASPSFVFRAETEPAGLPPGRAYPVSDLELASRLSFFLWSSGPDDELLRLAAEGRLRRPDVLRQQVRRMLADPRSGALVVNFAGQWLHLRNLRGIVPNSDLFPDFDDNLRQAFRREVEEFFASVIREDRNVIDLMTADYTFVNERLARHYGLRDVFGSHFRRVTLPDDARRGLLGKGAILMVTSHANTTSPVLRGKWVLENVLGAPPPPPPPDVPALQEPERTVPRSMRQQIERHRQSPACAGCHRLMDPIGFALENFDAVGAWRSMDASGAPLETGDVLATGDRVSGPSGLREALVKRPRVFAQTLTEKLLVYALGRGLISEDMPTVRRIVRDSSSQGYRFSSLVLGIVESVPFQMRVVSAVPAGAQASLSATQP